MKKINSVIVDFNPFSDVFLALYIDGELYKHGDDYHDDIHAYINAFLDGIEYTGVEVDRNTLYITDREVSESVINADEFPPNKLSELDGKLSKEPVNFYI